MGHAEAHELLADLALEPATLDRLDTEPGLDALRAHLEACAECRAELDAWRSTHRAIGDAVDTPGLGRGRLSDLPAEAPIIAPASLRAAVARIGMTPAASSPGAAPLPPDEPIPVPVRREPVIRTRLSWRTALPLVAALAVLATGAALLRDQAVRLDAARAETAELEQVTAVLDRLLQDPSHHVVGLTATDGSAGGTIAWSSRDVAVMTTALARPAAGSVYRCWIERGGVRSPVGRMWFAGDLAYWTGSLDEWATISFDQGGRFGVSLESASGPGGHGAAVLVADLGS